MILIAERVGLLSDDNAKDGLLKRAHRQWSEKAVFEWKIYPALASPSLLTCDGYSPIGDVAPDQFHSTLDHLPIGYSTSSGEDYTDSGAQGDSHPEAFLIHGNEASSNLHQSTSVFDSTTRRVPGTHCPNELWKFVAENKTQEEVVEDRFSMEAFYHLSEGNEIVVVGNCPCDHPPAANIPEASAGHEYLPDQGLTLSHSELFNNLGKEAESNAPWQSTLSGASNETLEYGKSVSERTKPRTIWLMRLSIGEATLDKFDGLNAFLYEAPGPPSSYRQAPTCSTIQSQDMTWPTLYLDDDWTFLNASHDKTDNHYQPPSQNFIGDPGGMPQSTFGGDTSFYDGCLISPQGETSKPRRTEYDLAQAKISLEPPNPTNSSQTFQNLEWADPTFTMDMSAAIDNDGASPSDFPNFVSSLPPAVSAASLKPPTTEKSNDLKKVAEDRWKVSCIRL